MMSDDRRAIGGEVHMDNGRPRVGNGVKEQTKADLRAQIRRGERLRQGAEEAERATPAAKRGRPRDESEKWIVHGIGADPREDLGCPLLGFATKI
jgi:hypothetical protein